MLLCILTYFFHYAYLNCIHVHVFVSYSFSLQNKRCDVQYYLVKFDANNLEIIHDNWVEDRTGEKLTIWFPQMRQYSMLRKYLRNNSPSHSTWPTYEVTLLLSRGKKTVGMSVPIHMYELVLIFWVLVRLCVYDSHHFICFTAWLCRYA